MFRYVVRSDPVTIEAPVEVVWGVLTDVANYAEWNPFTPSVKTDLQLGSPVHTGLLHAKRNGLIEAM